MTTKYTFTLPMEFSGERLDISITRFVQANYDQETTRERIRDSIVGGKLILNRRPITKAGYKVKGEEEIELTLSTKVSELIPDDSVEFEIVFEDDSIMVINKPVGLVVHPGAGVKESTLVHGILSKLSLDEDDERERPGIVHRLDKGTSGLMVVAKTTKAKLKLQKQFKPPRTIHRNYLCIVKGMIQIRRGVIFENGVGSVSAPLARSDRNRTTFATNFEGGKDAVTHFKIEKTSSTYHLMKCSLETGRTHQIRAHMKYVGLPIVGDVIYGGEKKGSWPLLHAKQLSFIHPVSGLRVSFEVEVPANFKLIQKEIFDS